MSKLGKYKDLTGQKFGKITVVKLAGFENGWYLWECICDCGNKKIIKSRDMKKTKSCGCMKGAVKDITGNRYGKLTVMNFVETKKQQAYFLCRCDCGKEIIIRSNSLKMGRSKSCGCLGHPQNIIHGDCGKTKLYKAWSAIQQRCENPKNKGYFKYGGRGIKLCQEWHDYVNFKKWAVENGYKENAGLSIDRIDNNGNYEPSNCRWTNIYVQSHNTRKNHNITYNGETKCISEWARVLDLERDIIWNKVRRGTDGAKAIELAIKKYKSA